MDNQNNNEDLLEVTAWMSRQGINVQALLSGTLRELGPGKHLPKGNLVRFQRVAILNTFLNHWLKLHQDTPWQKVPEADRNFLMTTVVAGIDGRAFEKALRSRSRLAHLSDLAAAGAVPKDGNPAAYEGFVAQSVESITRRFFERFETGDPRAARGALRYLIQTAVSAYRGRFAGVAARQPRGLLAYLDGNPRLEVRTRLAIKLVLMAESLSADERRVLTKTYEWQPKAGRKYKIKEIADRLRYKNPATLSRKIWKVKQWIRSFSSKSRVGSSRTACVGTSRRPCVASSRIM